MKKYLSFSLLLSLLTTNLFAQNINFKIKGALVDSLGQPVRDAVIVFSNLSQHNPEDSVQITLSEKDGSFEQVLSPGRYQLKIAFWNKNIYQKQINLKENTDLGKIVVRSVYPTTKLKETTIKGERSDVALKGGKLIFSPHIASAGNVWDLLKITPMVLVENEAIGIAGKKGAPKILVNGKQLFMTGIQLENYLKNISAKNAVHIEVEQNTLSEDDAESKNGLINIILKKNETTTGYKGDAHLTYQQATYPSVFGGASFNYFKPKFRWSSSINFSHSKRYVLGENTIHYPDYLLKEKNTTISKSNMPEINTSIDYQINNNNDFQAGISYANIQWDNSINNHSGFFTGNTVDSNMTAIGDKPQTMSNLGLNAFYQHKFDSAGKQLSVDFNHVRYGFNRNQKLLNSDFDAQGMRQNDAGLKNENDQKMQLTTLALNTLYPTKFANFSWGAKLTFVKNLNTSDFYNQSGESWIPDYSLFDHFNYYEYTQALFFKGTKNLGKWNLTLGIRGEHTNTSGQSLAYHHEEKREFWMLFPSGNISYTLNKKNAFSLTYTRKVTRPNFAQVNPFVQYQNQYATFQGNPFLEPYFSHNIDFTYLWKQKWVFSLSYEQDNNLFSELEITQPNTNVRKGIVANFVKFSNLSLNINTHFNINGIWSIYPQATLSRYYFNSNRADVKDGKSFSGYLTLYNQIQPWKTKSVYIVASGHYYFPNKSGVMQTKASWGETIGLTYYTSNRKFQFGLYANDLFKTDAFQYNSIVNDIVRNRYKYSDARYVMLSVRYFFRKGKVRAIKKRKKTNQNLLNRLGQ